eukprot:CAMPEP_0183702886 /NCGR_PEP_ID=MMETSP0737-20130205/838_1 /TAXON_ID=385413 /ORGANISM="Thalassiosira miniscula, Strain CCMP1093" /LENGTH=380 /DNA_ID=CAMNT_0025929569 /DNA_START=144 /DNA_END=1286 /DNA_ORIENTATION=+
MAMATTKRAISSAQLTIEHASETSSSSSGPPPKEELQFGKVFSPHMLQIPYKKELGGWQPPKITPFQDLKMSPAASALHYGLQCFEGMKAYKSIADDNDLRLFRPDLNMKRFKDSMDRLAMPGVADFEGEELIDLIGKLVRLDQDWIPSGEGYSLYLRPIVISTHPYLGVSPPDDLLLYVITSPVGPYYTSGFDPVRLTADSPYVRAWPGGSGGSKVGGNYAPTMKPGADAASKGYAQILWVFGPEDEVTEVGAMNVFFFLQSEDGKTRELVTPPLSRGDILPGVTRQSILELTKDWGEFDVVERGITMPEIRDAAANGRLIEAFGAGTAAVVTPISHIQYKGVDIEIPATGELTQRIFSDLMGIQYGRLEGPQGWSVKI